MRRFIAALLLVVMAGCRNQPDESAVPPAPAKIVAAPAPTASPRIVKVIPTDTPVPYRAPIYENVPPVLAPEPSNSRRHRTRIAQTRPRESMPQAQSNSVQGSFEASTNQDFAELESATTYEQVFDLEMRVKDELKQVTDDTIVETVHSGGQSKEHMAALRLLTYEHGAIRTFRLALGIEEGPFSNLQRRNALTSVAMDESAALREARDLDDLVNSHKRVTSHQP